MNEPEEGPGGGSEASTDLPVWFRLGVIGALSMTLIAHVLIDVFLDTYEGAGTSLMLGGIVGAALGVNEFLRGRNNP